MISGQGAADYQSTYPDEEREGVYGRKTTYQRPKDLKFRIVCAGVQRLIDQEGLNEEDVTIWMDWQSSSPHASSNPHRPAEQRLACAPSEVPPPHPGSPAPSAVYQDDKQQKLNGVKSLIKYATMCQYMLVPTAEQGLLPPFLQYIPGYGSRGWW